MAFNSSTQVRGDAAIITLEGELDAAAAPAFRDEIDSLAAQGQFGHLVLQVQDLTYMASAGLRALVFAKQKMGAGVEIHVVGARQSVAETIELTGFHHSVNMVDELDVDQLTRD